MILLGTAGYSYKDWVGPFYPQGTKDSMMLDYYCANFGFVEVNSSYYHMPRLQLFESLNKKTPEEFKFAVKLFGGFTHERNVSNEEAAQFIYAVSPLIESNKLVCLLAQFPYSFHYNLQNLDFLKRLRQWFDNVEVNIEFRNREWIKSEVMENLKKENLGFVCVDEPHVNGLIGNVTAITSNISYLRLHGRNTAKWYEGEGSERYDYLYRNSELEELVPRIRNMDESSAYTVISFNNHPRGQAIVNARTLAGFLQAG